MESYLIDHALKNIWCEPIQDRQAIIQPARLTLDGGTQNLATVGWEEVPVPGLPPTATNRYFHVYHIGQLPPSLLNITDVPETWISVIGVMGSYNVMIDIVLENGTRVPLRTAYIRVGANKNILLAIQHIPSCDYGQTIVGGNPVPADLDNSSINIRFYTNAWYTSDEFLTGVDGGVKPVSAISRRITTAAEWQLLKQDANAIASSHATQGLGIFNLDGFALSPSVPFLPEFTNRQLTYVYDDSVKSTKFFKVSDLVTFESTLDAGESKYILFGGRVMDTIDYADDIDVYLIKRYDPAKPNYWKGIYANRLTGSELRNLTHNTYAIKASLITSMINYHDLWDNIYEVEIMLVIRQGGLKRGLVHQHSRIEELYRLTEQQIVGAMSGVDALIPEWRAAELEASAYTQIMRQSVQEVENDLDNVTAAYGYNTATRIMNRNLCDVYGAGSARFVDVAPALAIPHPGGGGKRSVFLYNGAGTLLGSFVNTGTSTTIPLPAGYSTAVTAEVFHGTINSNAGQYMDMTVVNHDLKHFGFRCYLTPIVGGSPSYFWEDVTDTSALYTYYPNGIPGNSTPRIEWDHVTLIASGLYPCVKIAGQVHIYNPPLNLETYPGFVRFSVNAVSRVWAGGAYPRTDAVSANDIMSLQPATLDVFMDNVPLIETVDYYVVWPRIVITRKPERTPAQGLVVTVRTMGHCDPITGQRYLPREVGFVRGGILSVNGSYDIRNDRNIRILVADRLMRRSQVRFAEDGTGPLVTDGRPYVITDYINQVEPYTETTTIEYHNASLAIDAVVQDYLDLRLPSPVPAQEVIVGDRWAVYSPFCSGVIHALNIGFLNNGQLDAPYDNLDIQNWLSDYEYLLDFDPCVQNANANYVAIAPHQYLTNMTLNQRQYAFMERVIQQYLGNKVDLSPYVQIIGT